MYLKRINFTKLTAFSWAVSLAFTWDWVKLIDFIGFLKLTVSFNLLRNLGRRNGSLDMSGGFLGRCSLEWSGHSLETSIPTWNWLKKWSFTNLVEWQFHQKAGMIIFFPVLFQREWNTTFVVQLFLQSLRGYVEHILLCWHFEAHAPFLSLRNIGEGKGLLFWVLHFLLFYSSNKRMC